MIFKLSNPWQSFNRNLIHMLIADITLQWRHNGRDSVWNHQPHDCSLSRLFRRRSKKTSKLRVTGLCAENSPRTGEFPAQMANYAKTVSIWWRHHDKITQWCYVSNSPVKEVAYKNMAMTNNNAICFINMSYIEVNPVLLWQRSFQVMMMTRYSYVTS